MLYLDYESNPNSIVHRMLALGVSKDGLLKRFHSFQPASAPDVLEIDRKAFEHMVSRPYAVAVIDGVTISMMTCDLNSNSADDVARWHDLIISPHRGEDRSSGGR